MSAYLTLPTPMTDQQCLLDALVATGLDRASLRVGESVSMSGLGVHRTADIVIPRAVTGDLYNDIGFQRTPTGYRVAISDDNPRFGRAWLARVRESYDGLWADKQERLAEAERARVEAERVALVEAQRATVIERARAMGYRVKETRVGDVIKLALVKRSY